jgi:hypothetical protein
MEFRAEECGRKGATLSDKTARSEYGLTQDEIFAAIDAGKLQYRPAAMHGNPWLRLLRRGASQRPKSWRRFSAPMHEPEVWLKAALVRVNYSDLARTPLDQTRRDDVRADL